MRKRPVLTFVAVAAVALVLLSGGPTSLAGGC